MQSTIVNELATSAAYMNKASELEMVPTDSAVKTTLYVKIKYKFQII